MFPRRNESFLWPIWIVPPVLSQKISLETVQERSGVLLLFPTYIFASWVDCFRVKATNVHTPATSGVVEK